MKLFFIKLGYLLPSILILLSSCDELTRYSEERYKCENNVVGIISLAIKNKDIGSKVLVETLRGNINYIIEETGDDIFVIKSNRKVITIYRDKEIIRAIKNGRYIRVKCKKRAFKM